MLRCSDGSLYVGHSAEIDARLKEHEDGVGSAYTASRRPVTLVYSETCQSRKAAAKRERQLKRWTTAKKEALIDGDSKRLRRLAIRRRYRS